MSRRIDPADRAYLRRFVPAMALYVVLVWVSPFLIRALHAEGPLLWLIALLPAFPLSAVFWIIGRYLVDLRDEYRRMLEVRKALVATGFAMTLATGWGVLEVYAHAPHVPLFFVPIAWFAGLGLGSAVNAVIERRGGDAA
ncbi:hypothetical protein [Sphingomonas sp. UYP23]